MDEDELTDEEANAALAFLIQEIQNHTAELRPEERQEALEALERLKETGLGKD